MIRLNLRRRSPAIPTTRAELLAWHAKRAEQEAARRRALCDPRLPGWRQVHGTELKP